MSSSVTAEDVLRMSEILAGKTIRVQYFAALREQAGRSEEVLETLATTPATLYDELVVTRSLKLAPALLKVAVNAEFVDWDFPLSDGDRVVFIPPVAGG